MSIKYYPILKWKKGEQIALENFTSSRHCFPIIELVEDSTPEDFFSVLLDCYKETVYYDISRLDDDNHELLFEFNTYAKENDLNAYPLLNVNDISDDIINELQNNFSVKIPIPVDFQGPTFSEILNSLSKYLNRQVNLVLDAGEVLEQHISNSVFDGYSRIIKENLTLLSQFSDLIICLTSFPEKLVIESGEDSTYKRFDIMIFKALLKHFSGTPLAQKLHYSDYGVTKFTETEFDFSKLQYGILPKVKYTTDSVYIVKKGAKDRINNIFTRSYIDISKEIVSSSYFYGENFSYGDRCIFEKAHESTKPGGSTQWVTYCANHHLEVVMEQLSSLNDF